MTPSRLGRSTAIGDPPAVGEGQDAPDMPHGRARVLTPLFLVAVGGLSAMWLVLLTPAGLSFTPDTFSYVGAARNIVDGRGITAPFVNREVNVYPREAIGFNGAAPLFHYSPLFPVVLAAPIAAGASADGAARVVNVLSWAATSALVAWAVVRLTRGSYSAAILSVLLLVTTGEYAATYLALLTEPLFILLIMAALGVLARHLARPSRGLAITYIALAAAASLTRSVGAAVIVTGVVSLLLWYPASGAARTRHALGVGFVATAPVLLWLLYQAQFSSTGGARAIGWHPPPIRELRGARVTMTLWLTAPDPLPLNPARTSAAARLFLFLVIAAVGVGTVVWLSSTRRNVRHDLSTERNLVRVGLTFVGTYLLVLYAVHTLLDVSVPLHARLLAPLLPMVWVLSVAMLWNLARLRWSQAWIRFVVAVALLALALPLVVWHADGARDTYRSARRYGGLQVRINRHPFEGPMLEAIRRLPPHATLFTNLPDTAYYATERFAIMIPQDVDRFSGDANRELGPQLAELGEVLCRRPGVVAIFEPQQQQQSLAFRTYIRYIERRGRLRDVEAFADGVFLGAETARCRDG